MHKRLFNFCQFPSKVLITLIWILWASSVSYSQTSLTGLSSRWNDAWHEWDVFAIDNDEDITGDLHIKWPLKKDWSEWTLTLDDLHATIRLKYATDNHHWELRTTDNTIVEFKSKWRNDPTKWRIHYGGERYDWQAPYPSDLNYWYFEDEANNFVEMFTVYEDDPRDWEFVDGAKDLHAAVKLAMMFITMFYSTPKI